MQEQFVNFEIALKLKELGFDEPCFGYYTPMKKWMMEGTKFNPEKHFHGCNWTNSDNSFYFMYKANAFGDRTETVKNSSFTKSIENIAVPLWQQVVEWFMEKHDIHIAIPNYYNGWIIDIRGFKQNINVNYHSEPGTCLKNYYKARKQAILKALELVPNESSK